MLSAICFKLDQSKIVSCGNGLRLTVTPWMIHPSLDSDAVKQTIPKPMSETIPYFPFQKPFSTQA